MVDWVPRNGVWPDGIMFVFDGGVLPSGQFDQIRLQSDEIASIKYFTLNEIAPRARPSMARRLHACVEALAVGRPLYLNFGRGAKGSVL